MRTTIGNGHAVGSTGAARAAEILPDTHTLSVLVENKPGANSILGADAVAKSPPDGYTLGMVIGAHAANATLYGDKLPYNVITSFAPASSMRARRLSAENPPKTTECTAPSRAHASIATMASGIIGR